MALRAWSRALLTLGVLASAGCVHAAPAPDVPFVLQGGRHLNVVSGYLRDTPGAVVRGFVRRDPLWSAPVVGRLDIVAYAADGAAIARVTTVWRGRFEGAHGPALRYGADLGVPRAKVARVTVSFRPGERAGAD